MKKFVAFIFCMIIASTLLACESTVEVPCDTEGCTNTVAVKGDADENRVVFCKECREKVLADN